MCCDAGIFWCREAILRHHGTDLQRYPFTPDFGGVPPLLAGRTEEKREITVGLEILQDGNTPSTIIISAPRGMGKSVLLNVLSDEVRKAGISFRKTHAGDIGTVQKLTEWLATEAVESARGGGRDIGGSVPAVVSAKYGHTTGPSFGEPAWDIRLREALLERHSDSPLIICVDEAHTLTLEVARSLGSLRHHMYDNKCPVWLLMAGLPGLDEVLRNANATFTERVTDLMPGMLSRDDSLSALRVPLENNGWGFNDSAILNVVDNAQGYPYFLQIWGKEIWVAGVEIGQAHLSAELVDMASQKVRVQQDRFYSKRYKELMGAERKDPFENADIIAVTQAVIDTVRQPEGASLLDISNAIKEHLPKKSSPAPIRQYYEMKGFIWDPEPDRYQPGIQSLMNYIEEKLFVGGRNNTPPPASPAP